MSSSAGNMVGEGTIDGWCRWKCFQTFLECRAAILWGDSSCSTILWAVAEKMGRGGRVSITLTAWYRWMSIADGYKDGNSMLLPPAACPWSVLWEVASDAQVPQAGENNGVKVAGLGFQVQRQELLSGEKWRGLWSDRQLSTSRQEKCWQEDDKTLKEGTCCVEKGGTWYTDLFL